jgi:hypothetical protein
MLISSVGILSLAVCSYLQLEVALGLALGPLHDVVATDDWNGKVDEAHDALAVLRERQSERVDALLEPLVGRANVAQERQHLGGSSLVDQHEELRRSDGQVPYQTCVPNGSY